MKRTPLTIRSKRRDPLLALWGKAVRAVWGETCLKCGRSAPQWKIDAAHILSRGAHPRLKYEPLNGIALCFTCHRWYDQHKGSHHDGEADRWVRAKIGEQRYQKLLIEDTFPRPDKETIRIVLRALASGPARRAAGARSKRASGSKPAPVADLQTDDTSLQ